MPGVAKDRAAPFSRKHRRYWLPVTGGMLLIGAINLVLGFSIWEGEPKPPEPIIFDVPKVNLEMAHLAPTPVDAGVDAAAAAAVAPATATPR